MQQALDAVSRIPALAQLLQISRQRVARWRTIPAEYAVVIEAKIGLPRERVRPDRTIKGAANEVRSLSAAPPEARSTPARSAWGPTAAARTGIAARTAAALPICCARRIVRRSSIEIWRIAGALARPLLVFSSLVFLSSQVVGHPSMRLPPGGHAMPRAGGPWPGTPAPWPSAAGSGGRCGRRRRRRGGGSG